MYMLQLHMAESYARDFGVALAVCDYFYFNYGTIFMEKPFGNRKLGSSNVCIFSGGLTVLNVAGMYIAGMQAQVLINDYVG